MLPDELLTTVLDRHDAQPCYCGEHNCQGYIGGKTQTDVAAMDDLYLDGMASELTRFQIVADRLSALGISDEVEREGLKGNKRKKSKKLDEDYMVCIHPASSWSLILSSFSLFSNPCWRRMCQRSYRPFDRLRAAKSCRNLLYVLRFGESVLSSFAR